MLLAYSIIIVLASCKKIEIASKQWHGSEHILHVLVVIFAGRRDQRPRPLHPWQIGRNYWPVRVRGVTAGGHGYPYPDDAGRMVGWLKVFFFFFPFFLKKRKDG